MDRSVPHCFTYRNMENILREHTLIISENIYVLIMWCKDDICGITVGDRICRIHGLPRKQKCKNVFLPRDHKTRCLFMGLLGIYMVKVTRVLKKLVGSAVFLKLVRPLAFTRFSAVAETLFNQQE